MKHFTETWIGNKAWLMVGKGPTSIKYRLDMRDEYTVIGINQAARFTEAPVAVFVDYEAFLGTDLDYAGLQAVWMPSK